MGTGYMGMDEPEVIPHGAPTTETPDEKTIINPEQEKPEPAPAEEPPKEVIAPPVTEEPKTEEVVTSEKVIEKIIEKYPEFKDERAKTLYERLIAGETDEVYNYLAEMKKDYTTMSDLDVVREGLTKKHPEWTKQDIELELRAEYGKQLEKYNLDDFDKEADPEGYKEAQKHNEQAEQNELRLQRAARDFRVDLKSKQQTIELPKIEQPAAEPVAAVTAPTQEQLDEAKRNWAEAAENQVKDLTDFKFNVGDDKNPEEVVFKVTDEDKALRVEKMKTWNGKDFMAGRGWTNADGTFNLLKIAEDVHTLESLPKIAKSMYTQGTKDATKKVVKEIKNIDDQIHRNTVVPAEAGPVDGGYWD